MAGNNSSEIRVAGSGRILVAAAGAEAPTDFTTDWDPAVWTDLGYTSTDGVTFGKKDKLDPIETWQSISPARYVYESRDLTLKFSLLQFNEDTLPFFMGGSTVATVDAANSVYSYDVLDDPQVDERALGLEFTDSASVSYRFVIPRGLVTASDDIKLVRKSAAMLGVTFTAVSSGDSTPLATFVMKDPAYAS
ncbi:phage tail tube protein [Peterkaempfera bronchialis]|uniref:Phage tail protein n=1 Tax=Peterkaempfera bronchialis TaxID=2126346 RepID=A0A345SWE9_9ACTN|nr:phage tail protein [Peterkaempfera bronchialis]AXI78054.1 phage tail protein [Peterkaempfera bronchialis]